MSVVSVSEIYNITLSLGCALCYLIFETALFPSTVAADMSFRGGFEVENSMEWGSAEVIFSVVGWRGSIYYDFWNKLQTSEIHN